MRIAPKRAEFVFIFEEFGKLPEQGLHKLGGGEWAAIRAPEACGADVLGGAGFAIGELNHNFLGARRWDWRWALRIADTSRFWEWSRFGIYRLAVPLGIEEVLVSVFEIVDSEIVLALIKAGAAADDLFELDHAVDRTEQDCVADVTSVNAG